MPLLEVRGLEKSYGRRKVVNGVDFDVNQGEVVGLLGPNGAGKTTSFRMTIGLISADGGKVTFDGRDVTHLPMYLRARAGMGYLAQDSSVFKQLTVEDNLMAILETCKHLNRRQRRERQDELLDHFGLTKIRGTKANQVSGGERRRLEIARSLITEPKLIMLDEPFAGIDPKTVIEIQDQIRGLVERYDIGILLTDHQFRETIQVTNRTYVIREGRVFAYGDRDEIVNNPEVRRHYIGDRFDVGHLLDNRAPHSLPETRPGLPAAPEPVVDVVLAEGAPPPVAVEASDAPGASEPVLSPEPRPAAETSPITTEPPSVAPAPGQSQTMPPPEAAAQAAPPPMVHRPPPMLPEYDPTLGSSITVLGGVYGDPIDLTPDVLPPRPYPGNPLDEAEDDDGWPVVPKGR